MMSKKLDIELVPSHTVTRRTSDEKEKLINRMKRIEGQVRGIQRMIEDDRYCIDVLVQLSAISAALKKVGYTLLEDHTRGCVKNAVEQGDGDEAIDELMKVIEQFSRS
ncbi:metal-sensing transcriptional repressor [Bacillus sp. H-16]|uniref:metal-sensitive transcriptional regulator n=1 Tax=Alteribacter salitolerans TaxID=2912333 RepID=UPI0019656CC9|nr:metal-sensing transcriptional repressor [Alteribacter salitolerans]MBM7094290.1 metal-sensing transcriptional repressor [Alteribacter salitolerans]